MRSPRFQSLTTALLLVGCLCLGCGPSRTSPDPQKVQTPAEYRDEMTQQEGALMGDRPAPRPKPAEKTEPTPTEEKPAP